MKLSITPKSDAIALAAQIYTAGRTGFAAVPGSVPPYSPPASSSWTGVNLAFNTGGGFATGSNTVFAGILSLAGVAQFRDTIEELFAKLYPSGWDRDWAGVKLDGCSTAADPAILTLWPATAVAPKLAAWTSFEPKFTSNDGATVHYTQNGVFQLPADPERHARRGL
jgi:hypothetical protein